MEVPAANVDDRAVPSSDESLASIATTLVEVANALDQIVDGLRTALTRWGVELGQ